jgi:hypothetical protein
VDARVDALLRALTPSAGSFPWAARARADIEGMRHFLAVALLASVLAGCGASALEIKRAHEARYHGPAIQLFMGAARAVDHKHYALDASDPDHGELYTLIKVFSETGDLESAGAGNVIQTSDKSIALAFHVRVVTAGAHDAYAIAVDPVIRRFVAGRPNADDVSIDDPSLPGWVHGRVDELEVEINDELSDFQIKTP